MMWRRTVGCVAVVGLIVWASGTARGQVGEVATVSGTGKVTLRPVPSALRMSVRIQASGASVGEALSRLAERQKAAVQKLKTLEAEADSIVSERPTLTPVRPVYRAATYPVGPVPSTAPPKAQYTPSSYTPQSYGPTQAGEFTPVVPAPWLPAPPAVEPTHPAPTAPIVAPAAPRPVPGPQAVRAPFTATTTVTADWALGAETVEQALVAGEGLKGKLTALEVSPPAKPKEAIEQTGSSPAAQPAAYNRYSPARRGSYTRPVPAPATLCAPKFLYVAKISAEQRRAGLKKAYAKAEAQASELAAAAGRGIGELQSLRGQASDRAMPLAASYRPVAPYGYVPGNAVSVRLKEHETGSASASEIRYSCRVTATFRLQ
jgi:uncharacterized protein YggE